MAVSPAMRRLLRVLLLEEEQCRKSLEAAVSVLRTLEHALEAASERGRGGRRLIAASAGSGDLTDRLAGLEETRMAMRRAMLLRPPIEDAGQQVSTLRETYLAKRVERRQAETLILQAEAAQSLEAGRRSQQLLDDWYLNRMHRASTKPEA